MGHTRKRKQKKKNNILSICKLITTLHKGIVTGNERHTLMQGSKSWLRNDVEVSCVAAIKQSSQQFMSCTIDWMVRTISNCFAFKSKICSRLFLPSASHSPPHYLLLGRLPSMRTYGTSILAGLLIRPKQMLWLACLLSLFMQHRHRWPLWIFKTWEKSWCGVQTHPASIAS